MTNSINQQLNIPEIFEKIKTKAEELIEHLQSPEARKLADSLEEKLKIIDLSHQNTELHEQYQRIILKLKLVSLPIYDNNTVLDLIKNHFVDGLRIGLNMSDILTSKVYSVPDLVWPDFAQELIVSLKKNQQEIGFQSVKKWLLDYNQAFGSEKHFSIEQHQYINQNPNVKILNEQEKKWLLQLFQFYDNLKPLPISALEGKTEEKILNTTPQKTLSLNKLLKSKTIHSQPLLNLPHRQKTSPPSKTIPPPPELPTIPAPAPARPTPPRSPQSPPPTNHEFPKTINLSRDSYQEPIAETLQPGQVEPRVSGNVVDLKNH